MAIANQATSTKPPCTLRSGSHCMRHELRLCTSQAKFALKSIAMVTLGNWGTNVGTVQGQARGHGKFYGHAKHDATHCEIIGVFTLVMRGWVASEFLTHASKFNMTPNGDHQIIGPDQSHMFDAGVNFLTHASPV